MTKAVAFECSWIQFLLASIAGTSSTGKPFPPHLRSESEVIIRELGVQDVFTLDIGQPRMHSDVRPIGLARRELFSMSSIR